MRASWRQDQYTVKFEWRVESATKEERDGILTKNISESVGSFFDAEGYFDEARFNKFLKNKLKVGRRLEPRCPRTTSHLFAPRSPH